MNYESISALTFESERRIAFVYKQTLSAIPNQKDVWE